jgi:Phytochelatin synthase
MNQHTNLRNQTSVVRFFLLALPAAFIALHLSSCGKNTSEDSNIVPGNPPVPKTGRSPSSNDSTPRPKYGGAATLLSGDHSYIQKQAAADYWAISPYYAAQRDHRSCSVACITMVVNGARYGRPLKADDELATQQEILKRVDTDGKWKGHGITLDQLKYYTEKSLKAYGIEKFTVATIPAPDTSDKTFALIHEALVKNEASAKNFIIAYFVQKIFTGDYYIGHYAPIGGYDIENKKVLIMDPDRTWYEPYWVSEETFFKGVTERPFQGLLWIQIDE